MTTTTSSSPMPPPSKRQKMAHDALFPTFYLPLPAVTHILGFLDVATRVRATGCNRVWRNEIYGDPHLWKEIDFDDNKVEVSGLDMKKKEPPQQQTEENKPASRITDEQLGALLRNCRAVDRCEVLKLNGCFKISGKGLQPFWGSKVLREVDLRLVPPPKTTSNRQASLAGMDATSDNDIGPDDRDRKDDDNTPKIDPTFVIPILSSMPPLAPAPSSTCFSSSSLPPPQTSSSSSSAGLSLVKFDIVNSTTQYYSRFADEVGDFLYEFHQALRVKAEQNNPSHLCGYCHGNVLEGKSDDCKRWIMSTAYCEACKTFSCGNGKCPSPWNCLDCLVQCCQPMGPGSTCMGQNSPNHKVLYMCKSCDRLQCEDCFEGLLCANDDCCNEYCTDVNKDCLSCLSGCDICNSETELKFYCPDCIAQHIQYCHGSTKTTKTTNKAAAAEKTA